jgi:hypothetical protein
LSTDAGDPSVNGSSGSSAVNAGSPSGGVTPELRNEIQKIVAGIVRDAVPRAIKSAVGEEIAPLREALSGLVPQKSENPTPVAGNDASGEKLSLKALHEQIANLNKAIESERSARAKAEAGAKDARMRAEVERRLAAKLGSDNPLVSTLMDSLYDVKRRFVETPDGRLAVKFTDAGFDDFKSLDEGVDALFAGELKHLVQTSKAAALPPSGYRVAGQPVPAAPKGMQVNPLLAEIANGIAKDRPELAPALAQMAMVPAAPERK